MTKRREKANSESRSGSADIRTVRGEMSYVLIEPHADDMVVTTANRRMRQLPQPVRISPPHLRDESTQFSRSRA